MTEGNGGGDQGDQAAPAGSIVLAFPDGGSDCRVTIDPATTPGQVYLAAYLLDLIAHEIRTGQLMQAAAGGRRVELAGADEITRIVQQMATGKH